jgi:hypothetical protein
MREACYFLSCIIIITAALYCSESTQDESDIIIHP